MAVMLKLKRRRPRGAEAPPEPPPVPALSWLGEGKAVLLLGLGEAWAQALSARGCSVHSLPPEALSEEALALPVEPVEPVELLVCGEALAALGEPLPLLRQLRERLAPDGAAALPDLPGLPERFLLAGFAVERVEGQEGWLRATPSSPEAAVGALWRDSERARVAAQRELTRAGQGLALLTEDLRAARSEAEGWRDKAALRGAELELLRERLNRATEDRLRLSEEAARARLELEEARRGLGQRLMRLIGLRA